MASDDVHDLFGRDDADDADDADESADEERSAEPEGSAASKGSGAPVDFPPLDESGSSADTAGTDAAESPTTTAERVAGDAPDESESTGGFEPAPSKGPTSETSRGDDTDAFDSTEPTAMSFEESDESAEDDADPFEPGASTTPAEGTVADDAGETEMDWSSTDSEDAPGDDADAFEPATSDSSSTGELFEADTDGPESPRSTTSAEEGAGDPADESESTGGFEPAEASTSSGGAVEDDTGGSGTTESSSASHEGAGDDDADDADDADGTRPSVTTSPEGTTGSATDEPEPSASTRPSSEGATEDADGDSSPAAATVSDSPAVAPGEAPAEEPDGSGLGEAKASAEGTIADDREASDSSVATITTDEPTPGDHDESGMASLDEPGSVRSEAAVDERVAAPASGSNRLPTGIDELDRAMGGGVPPGRLVVLVADPGVQSELIVDTVLAQRDTLYVTTDRPDWEVMKDIEPGLGTGTVEIRDHTPDSLLSGLDSLLDDLGTSSNFVLDSVNELELVPRKRYRIFLSDVKRRLFDTGSVGLFTGVTVGHESARDLTLRRADVVLRLETRTTDSEIENRLSVPKFRGGAAVTETIKLELTDEVKVAR